MLSFYAWCAKARREAKPIISRNYSIPVEDMIGRTGAVEVETHLDARGSLLSGARTENTTRVKNRDSDIGKGDDERSWNVVNDVTVPRS
jgi:hypothetical protein